MVPLFEQDSPSDERKSKSSSPLLLQTLFPQRVCCELVSEPIISGMLWSMAYLARGVVSCDGAGPLISMYEAARMTSVELS